MNYFAYQSAAKRYASFRPYFHPFVIEKIKTFLRLQDPVLRALDIACGTGQSSLALTAIASEIIGLESSQAMLEQAVQNEHIHYLLATAENIPLPTSAFDIITVANAFHWFDRTRFLTEAARVLHPNGWLIIYTNGFQSRMQGNPAFRLWSEEIYLTRYPIPPRNNQPLASTTIQTYGFHCTGNEKYTNEVMFSPQELANYLMTQSNVIAAVEQGTESAENVYEWLLHELIPLFPMQRGTFIFGGEITYLQKGE
jgi:ubiquinone/menaquinone biosynthesis C-methylase UbiE